jgi:hypothetical protein
VLVAHKTMAADRFEADDATCKGLATEMLDAGTAAVSLLRLYLEDPSRQLHWYRLMTLQDAHRQLAAFRARRMRALEGAARRAAALGQCRLLGLVVERVDEESRAGETPLVRAVAGGVVGLAGIALLVEAGADVGTALGAAADNGQRSAPSRSAAPHLMRRPGLPHLARVEPARPGPAFLRGGRQPRADGPPPRAAPWGWG